MAAQASSKIPNVAQQTFSKWASLSIYTISITRVVAGSLMLLTPQLGSQIFGIRLAPESDVVGRLFGVRDLVLGGLLWGARANLAKGMLKSNSVMVRDARRDLRNLLMVGMGIDLVDILSSAASVASGDMKGRAISLVGGGAAECIGLAALALRRL